MSDRRLTTEQIDEIQSGDGMYYMPQETALCPGISGVWPDVIKHPKIKNGRLVKRVAEVPTAPIVPLKLPEAPDLPIDVMELGISSGEFCDACDCMTDVFVNFHIESDYPYVVCRACIEKAHKLVNGN